MGFFSSDLLEKRIDSSFTKKKALFTEGTRAGKQLHSRCMKPLKVTRQRKKKSKFADTVF